MQTSLADFIKDTPDGREAEAILRSCVHCGFCTATCPTYQLLGDELDGPRGRIYLIKQVLEGAPAGRSTQVHLDRCLTCLACETTCPSGVRYGHLLEIGRDTVEQQVARPWREQLVRALLRRTLPHRRRFEAVLALGRAARPLLPAALRRQVPPRPRPYGSRPTAARARRMLLLEGCVQPGLAPEINAATARVFDALGIALQSPAGSGCCGALSLHLGARDEALAFMRRNIDTWWPAIEAGAEAIVVNASGCGVAVKDYGHLLREDPAYAEKAARISALTRDPAEVLANEDLEGLDIAPRRLAFHSPCTLQHGQQLNGRVEALLGRLGFELSPVADAHLCCGSAGTYSVLQAELSGRLRRDKLARLEAGDPELIATANIGCLSHLRGSAARPVHHWIELLDPDSTARP